MPGKRHFAPVRAGPGPVLWSALSAGARPRRGLAGLRWAAVAAGTELTRHIRQSPGPLRYPLPASLMNVSWPLPAPAGQAVR